MASKRRKKTQAGQEILEFGAMMICVFVPLFTGSFVVGMNLIRSIQCNQVCRDLVSMYIHGADFSTYPIQQEAQRLAQGLNLQMPAFPSGTTNVQANTGTSGNGIVTVSQIMWIGGSNSNSCLSVTTCTNQNSFVYTQQIQFGNSNLSNSNTVTVGVFSGPACTANTGATTSCVNQYGIVSNYITDSKAALPSAAQTALAALWAANHSTGQSALADCQVIYLVETYFQSPDLNVSALSGNGVYARYFM